MPQPELADRVHDWFVDTCEHSSTQITAIADFEEALHIEIADPLDLDCMVDALHQAGYETIQQTVEGTFTVEAVRVAPSSEEPKRRTVGVPYRSEREIVVPHSYIDADSLGNTETFQHLCLYFERRGPTE